MVTGSSQALPHARACPFCGVVTDAPHETQEGCIQALHVEITRMRGILDHLHPADYPLSSLSSPKDSRA